MVESTVLRSSVRNIPCCMGCKVMGCIVMMLLIFLGKADTCIPTIPGPFLCCSMSFYEMYLYILQDLSIVYR